MSSTNFKRRPFPISIAIPSSFIDVYTTKAQKTQQIGRIARAAAIFQVDEILIYRDRNNRKQSKNCQLITRILEYIETPQYLRKHLFGKLPELRYAGLLPPLRTPHHPLEKKMKELKIDEIREGFAYTVKGEPVVDVGVEIPLPLLKSSSLKLPTRITVKIHRKKSITPVAYPCQSTPTERYWGYKVIDLKSTLGRFLVKTSIYNNIIALTRKGTPITEKIPLLQKQWSKIKHLLLLFGSHKEGLPEILEREGYKLSSISKHSLNLLLFQGVTSVRTEEAVFIGLATFRLIEQWQTR